MRWGILLLLALILVPGAQACSFFAEDQGGNTVRVHDMRSSWFGFATVQYWIDMGDGTGWQDLGVYEGGNTPAPFTYQYTASGPYTVTLSCTDVDTQEEEQYQLQVLGGAFGLPGWFLPAAVAAVLGVVVITTIKKKNQKKVDAEPPERTMQAVRRNPVSTGERSRRSLGCFPAPDERPTPLVAGRSQTYWAEVPEAGQGMPTQGLEADWEGAVLHLDWPDPPLETGHALAGFQLHEEWERDDAPAMWHHRANLEPDVRGLDIDFGDAEGGPHRITAYEVRPVFEAPDGSLHQGHGNQVRL